MLDAIAAENAFIVSINSGLTMEETSKAASAIAVEFHEFLKATYAQDLPSHVERYVWDSVWGGTYSDMGYDVIETRYAEETAEARKSYSLARMA